MRRLGKVASFVISTSDAGPSRGPVWVPRLFFSCPFFSSRRSWVGYGSRRLYRDEPLAARILEDLETQQERPRVEGACALGQVFKRSSALESERDPWHVGERFACGSLPCPINGRSPAEDQNPLCPGLHAPSESDRAPKVERTAHRMDAIGQRCFVGPVCDGRRDDRHAKGVALPIAMHPAKSLCSHCKDSI